MSADNFIKTFSQLHDKLHRVACKYLKDELDAEDAVQDAFYNLWSNRIPESSEEARNRVFAILRNVCLNMIKRRRHFVELSECKTSIDNLDVEDIEREKNLLMSSLSPLQREIFQMSAFENIEYEVIAKRLDMSVDAVRMNMSRARRKSFKLPQRN